MPVYILTIDGVEHEALLSSFSRSDPANRIGTLSCEVGSANVSPLYRPQLRDEVVVTEDGTRIFGGVITDVNERGWVGPNDDPILTRINAIDFNGLTERRLVSETIPAGTLKAALLVLIDYLTPFGTTLDPSQADGPTLPELVYDYVKLTEVLKGLADLTEWVWEIDDDNVLRMFAPASMPAPWDLIEGEASEIGDVEVEPVEHDYADRIVVKAGPTSLVEQTEVFAGDGVEDTFQLSLPIAGPLPGTGGGAVGYAVVNVSYGSGTESLGSTSAGLVWEYDPVTLTVTRSLGAPANGSTITVRYQAQFPITVIASNSPWTQEALVTAPDIITKAQAEALAESLLAQRSATVYVVRYATVRPGLKAGMTQTITVPRRDIDGTFVISEVVTQQEPNAAPGDSLMRRVTAIGGGQITQQSWRHVYDLWLGGGTGGSSSGSATVNSGGTPSVAAPPDRAVQFNDGGSFGGSAAFLFDNTLAKVELERPGAVADDIDALVVRSGSGANPKGVVSVSAVNDEYQQIGLGMEDYIATDPLPGYVWKDGAATPGIGLELLTDETVDDPIGYTKSVGVGIETVSDDGTTNNLNAYQVGGLGTGAVSGMKIRAERNDSGSGAASAFGFQERDGTKQWLWAHDDKLRLHTSPPTEDDSVSHTAGTEIGGGFQFIEEQTPSGTGVVTFSALGAYTHLHIKWSARGTQSADNTVINLTFNGDTGSNYDRQLSQAFATTVSGSESLAATSAAVGNVVAANGTANAAGAGMIDIFDYRGTTFHKVVLATTGFPRLLTSGNFGWQAFTARWRSASAITSVTLTLASGNYVAGSKFTAYGMR